MDSNHDIVPTLRMFDGLMMNKAADEIERLRSLLAEKVTGQAVDAKRMTEIARKWMKKGSGASPEFYWGDFYDCVREIIAAPQPSQPAQSGEHCVNCGASVDPLCACERGRKLAAQSAEQDERAATPCVHADNPKGCYRVRCQLGNKCVDDDMSPRSESANRSTGICFFCSEPIDGVHEADCPQAKSAAAAPDRHAILYEAGEALLAAGHGEAYEVLYRMMEECRAASPQATATRTFTDEQIAALRVAADALIERYAAPIRSILANAEQATAAQPVQTERALTDTELEKLYWTAMNNAADILGYMEEARALLIAAQPASSLADGGE